MKKLIVAAMLVLGATSAFAGDSDALKAVMKAKTYAEAEALVKQNLGQFANDAEKAKAYNKLVDLGMKVFNEQQTIQQTNQLMKKNDPVDENVMNEGAYNALMNAIECYKYDQLPNAKGKVAPKFNGNASRVWGARQQLVNAGQTAAQNNKADEVLKYWGAFLDTDSEPLFASVDAKQKEAEKEYIGQVALFAARYAYQAKDAARCEKYCDIAMTSEKEAKDALNLKLYVMKDGLKTKEDSLNYVNKLKDLYAKDPSNEVMLDGLNSMYSALKMEKEQIELLDAAIAKDPKNFVALANKGMMYIQKNDANNAIKCLKQALEAKPDNVVVMTYLGACYNSKAGEIQAVQGRKVVYQEAIKILDKAKELDPEKAQANWGYTRYQAYYGYYGPNAPETKKAEEESK
jgi:tetratricopeptide (TPR) repeat protein